MTVVHWKFDRFPPISFFTLLISFYRTNLISVKRYFLKKNNFNEPKSYPTFFPWALLASRLCFSREALGTSESHAMQNGALSSVYFAQLTKICKEVQFFKYFSNGTTQEWRTKFKKRWLWGIRVQQLIHIFFIALFPLFWTTLIYQASKNRCSSWTGTCAKYVYENGQASSAADIYLSEQLSKYHTIFWTGYTYSLRSRTGYVRVLS